jgi:hypothetical protein
MESHYATIREREEKRRVKENSRSCMYSTGIAIGASLGLSVARGLSFAFLRNKTNRWNAFVSGTRVAFCIYTPIFLICTQFDCMDRMFSDESSIMDREKRANDADEVDKWI